MKTIINTSILFLLAFSGINCKSIKTIEVENEIGVISPQDLLKSKKWNVRGKSVNIYYKHSETEKTLYVDGVNVGSTQYYISDSNCFEQTFNPRKVGQISPGRYLVTDDSCYYLTVIDNSTIQISYLSHENPTTTTLIAKE